MLSALTSTLLATGLAACCAILLGIVLDQFSSDLSFVSRVLARSIELRGSVPTLIAAPLLDHWLGLPPPVTLGILVGAYQSLAVARWVRGVRVLKRAAESPAAASGSGWESSFHQPVRTSLTLCLVHVVTLEAVLSLVELPPVTVSLGSWMANALAPSARWGAVLALVALFLLLETGATRIGRRFGSDASKRLTT